MYYALQVLVAFLLGFLLKIPLQSKWIKSYQSNAYLKIATQFRFLPIQQFLNSFVVDQKMQSFFFE